MSIRVVRYLYSEAPSAASPLEAIRAVADPERFVRAKLTGEQIRGATVTGLRTTLHRVAVDLDDGRELRIEPNAGGDIAWTLRDGKDASDPPTPPPDLSTTGEIEFLMPQGFTYVWKWRHIRDLLVGAAVVMCSAERRVFNLHCRGVEMEFDCYEIERGGTRDRIVVFAPF
jgi:hypothetical protein